MDERTLCVVFDEGTIRHYGGSGAGLHSDAEIAKAQGFPTILSWGTLTVLPFWELMARCATGLDEGGRRDISVRLTKPVCAGDEVTYAVVSSTPGEGGTLKLEFSATTERFGTVATATATLGSSSAEQPIKE
jgi:acyl dehydratase